MKILKNIEKSGFSKIFIFLQIVLGVGWDIRGCMRARERLLEASYVGCAALKGLQGVRRCVA